MNYYEHHIGDYDADTAHLTWLEDMAYTRLMRLYYRREKPIPADVAQACRLVRAVSKDERKAVELVLREFFVLGEEGWAQARCESEIATYQKKVEHNQRVGKLGGRPRKIKTQLEPKNNPPGYFREPEQNPPQTPDPRHQTPDINTRENTRIDLTGQPGGAVAPARASPSMAAVVCMAIKAEGVASVNPSHPELQTLIDAGADTAVFALAARTAVEKGKGFAYVLGTVKGQMQDALAATESGLSVVKPVRDSPETFREKDARLAREKWERMTGRTHPDSVKQQALVVVDAEQKNQPRISA